MTAKVIRFPMERVRKAPRQEWKPDPGSGWFDWPSVPASPNYTPPELNTPAEQAALKAWASDQLARIERGLRDLEQHQQDWQYRFSADFVRPEPPGAA